MIWRDIVLDRNISKSELTKAFSTIFDIDTNQVSFIENIIDFEDNYLLTCIINRLPGNFCLSLDCYLNFEIKNEYDTISRLCKILDCQALITNDEGEDVYNAYAFILFEPSGLVRKIIVDHDLYDEYGELKIVSNS